MNEIAIVRHPPASPSDTGEIEKYVAALDDPTAPAAEFEWTGQNRIRIQSTVQPGQALSVQVSYHPGWHARAGNQALPVARDGLGLMFLRPNCSGACDIQLDYDGGWELRLCRYLSFSAIMALLLFLLFRAGSAIRSLAAGRP